MKKGRRKTALREYRMGKTGQVRSEGCSIIRPRPNGFRDTLDISLDMDHLLSSCWPGASIYKNTAHAKKNIV